MRWIAGRRAEAVEQEFYRIAAVAAAGSRKFRQLADDWIILVPYGSRQAGRDYGMLR